VVEFVFVHGFILLDDFVELLLVIFFSFLQTFLEFLFISLEARFELFPFFHILQKLFVLSLPLLRTYLKIS
jgi:hypothetical protein